MPEASTRIRRSNRRYWTYQSKQELIEWKFMFQLEDVKALSPVSV